VPQTHLTPPMRRYVPLLIAGIALIVSGCRDTVSPPQSAPLATLVPVKDMSFSSLVSLTEGQNANEFKFTFTREANGVQLGDFTLKWEANSVCERDDSGYGWEYFWKPCQAENEDVEMTARVWTEDGRTYVDFHPDIRFSPSRNVVLSTVRSELVNRSLSFSLMLKYSIYYTHRVGDTRFFIDEAWFDSEQRTRFNTQTGEVSREIRHFSGFVIRTGTEDAVASDVLGISSLEP
jgi:hypothetical protein